MYESADVIIFIHMNEYAYEYLWKNLNIYSYLILPYIKTFETVIQ